jgi:hypothetical protein
LLKQNNIDAVRTLVNLSSAMKTRIVRDRLGAVPVAPEEAARTMRSREGFVFLDSSLATANSVSLLACEPDLVLEGAAADWGRLESELAARQKPAADLGFPDGAAIGWIAFDGQFRFGFYKRLAIFVHDPGVWHADSELPGMAN